MTKQEAIEELKYHREMCYFNPDTGETDRPYSKECEKMAEALDMAIEALNQDQLRFNQGQSSDLISRQDAIDALHMHLMYRMGTDSNKKRLDEWINNLPSAQPEVIRCKDCKWWDKSEDSPFGYCMAMKHGYMSTNWEIGIYRRYKGDFYCADAERRTDEADYRKE